MLRTKNLVMLCNKKEIGSTELLKLLGLKLTSDNYKQLKKEMSLFSEYIKPIKGKTYYEINETKLRIVIANKIIEEMRA